MTLDNLLNDQVLVNDTLSVGLFVVFGLSALGHILRTESSYKKADEKTLKHHISEMNEYLRYFGDSFPYQDYLKESVKRYRDSTLQDAIKTRNTLRKSDVTSLFDKTLEKFYKIF